MPKKSVKNEGKRSSRYIFGTLTAPKDEPYIGTRQEVDDILLQLKASSNEYEYSVISREKHDDGSLHYHFLIGYDHSVREGILSGLRLYFDQFSNTNEIKFGDDNKAMLIGYVSKDGDYYIDGKLSIEMVEKARTRYLDLKATQDVEKKEMVKATTKSKQENEIINWLYHFMVKNEYKINPYKRELYRTSIVDFNSHLISEGFFKLFGMTGIKLAKELIENNEIKILPVWKPNLNILRFLDCFYNMDIGEIISLEEGKKQNLVPVNSYEYNIPTKEYLPESFIKIITNQGWDIETFRHDYGCQFRGKIRREKNLYLYGPTTTGKSTLAIPYKEVFKDIIGDIPKDDRFSMGAVALEPKCLLEEQDLFMSTDKGEILKLLEGVPFKTAVKHKSSVDVIPKTMVITTNIYPPFDSPNEQDKAIIARLYTYLAARKITGINFDYMEDIRDESGKIAFWMTYKTKTSV